MQNQVTSLTVDLTAGNHRTETEIGYHADICFDANPRDSRTRKLTWPERLPLESDSVDLLVFDPPHQVYGHGKDSWLVDRYSSFENGLVAASILTVVFEEIRRVLKPSGSCLLKWSTNHKPLEWILGLSKMEGRIISQRNSLASHPEKPFSHKAQAYWVELFRC